MAPFAGLHEKCKNENMAAWLKLGITEQGGESSQRDHRLSPLQSLLELYTKAATIIRHFTNVTILFYFELSQDINQYRILIGFY